MSTRIIKPDREWTEDEWQALVLSLVKEGIVKWHEIASTLLGTLNPPQVGTAIASKKSFQKLFPPRKTWQAVKEWFYSRPGRCESCGTLLELEAEHKVPREDLKEKADTLENMQILCKRCNAKKRPSHKNAGKTFLTAQSALMWILFSYRPKTYKEFEKICREYGLTMANIRFQEAWALAVWLSKIGKYKIKPD